MAASKKDLDELITKSGVGKRTAKKLHEANGTSSDNASTPSPPAPSGGHGPSVTEMPNFGEI